MDAIQNIRDNHAARWDITRYRDGWDQGQRDIDHIGTFDAPTARIFADEAIGRANLDANNPKARYYELGYAAAWIAATGIRA